MALVQIPVAFENFLFFFFHSLLFFLSFRFSVSLPRSDISPVLTPVSRRGFTVQCRQTNVVSLARFFALGERVQKQDELPQ